MEKQLQMIPSQPLQQGEQIRIRKAVSERVYTLTKIPDARQVLFKSLFRALKERYGVDSYKDIPRYQMQNALHFIAKWRG
ncbi:ORF6C domain-containing protein [Metasolibacillus sp.]|uniref:ORF6C domain-containing protein n=1 Tax=Metasolibacillus sp. TaxID=2703680 RepID=UPI0025F1551D|nr:ORF6C domain-containing protein [Metasolibacillus sp.]MCT6922783.1 ORF6C domain-containing protein [Metasolibacillus sp.]MCT6938878.1 ORF6C domain-containing protein [Metasolibacillus sp.]